MTALEPYGWPAILDIEQASFDHPWTNTSAKTAYTTSKPKGGA